MLWGIFCRRERWSLSWRGWLLVLAVLVSSFFVFVLRIYPFLAETRRVDTKVLVVEGWIDEYAIRAAVDEFRSHPYDQIFTTGGPEPGRGGYINDYNTEASVGADLLKANGVPSESVQMVPSRIMDRDRTYGSAIALRNWFREHNALVHSVNVMTEDVHARRSRLLFQKALGKGVAVGIIAVPNPDYDLKYWWRYSEGVKNVAIETLAYAYAKLFFYPSERGSSTNASATTDLK
jgi:uncharacterized SAM-binding protein YcdF (DUF218 family)